MFALSSTLTFLALGATVSLELPEALTCPSATSLAERLGRVGLTVVNANSRAELQVSLTASPEGLTLTAKRSADGKVFQRMLKAGDDCNTLERLVTVLIHSWVRLRLPPLAPKFDRPVLDGGASP